MKKAVCLQHVSFEGPGAFEKGLVGEGFSIERYLVPRDGLPDDAGDFLLTMGGPMSVNDSDSWIQDEMAFIHDAVNSGIPYLGICLGSQLLAKAMSGSVYQSAQVEIGMTAIRLTPDGVSDPITGCLPETAIVFEWHGEGINAPPGAVVLASSNDFPVQAFRVGTQAYGLLFHPELDETGIRALCENCPGDVERSGKTTEHILSTTLAELPSLNSAARQIITRLCREHVEKE